jgi:hypothetical protein
MAYTLQAFVGDLAVLEKSAPAGTQVIALVQGKGMIPLTEDVCDQFEVPFLPLTDEGLDKLPESVEALAGHFAERVAYLEAEFFGGEGTQAAAIWEKGELVFGPVVKPTAINEALQKLGVVKGDHHDEFDAMGFGSHRNTSDWVRESKH